MSTPPPLFPVVEDDPQRSSFVVHIAQRLPGDAEHGADSGAVPDATLCGLRLDDRNVADLDGDDGRRPGDIVTAHGACLAGAFLLRPEDDDGLPPQPLVEGDDRLARMLRNFLTHMAKPPSFDRRRVRLVIEADVSLAGVDAAGPVPRPWPVGEQIERAAREALGALGGWSDVKITDYRLTDP